MTSRQLASGAEMFTSTPAGALRLFAPGRTAGATMCPPPLLPYVRQEVSLEPRAPGRFGRLGRQGCLLLLAGSTKCRRISSLTHVKAAVADKSARNLAQYGFLYPAH